MAGAYGMLGSDVVAAASDAGHDVIGMSREHLDICDDDDCSRAIEEHEPDVVINCAAYTNVDGAEVDRFGAYQVNAMGVQNLALACREASFPPSLVHISTDYVFDGSKAEPYLEFDHPNPINVYGASKLAGENYIRHLHPEHYIIRSSWLYGRNGKNFVETIRRLLSEEKDLHIVSDQVGSPTFTVDLADGILSIIESECYGTYHMTNSNSCSWHEFAEEIAFLLGEDRDRVNPIHSSDFPRPAPRPANSVLENFALELRGLPQLADWKDALARYLATAG